MNRTIGQYCTVHRNLITKTHCQLKSSKDMRKIQKLNQKKLKNRFLLRPKDARFIVLMVCYLSSMFFAGNAFSQTTISLHLKNIKLETLIQEIEKNTEYVFLSKETIPMNSKVSVDVTNEKVDKILSKILPPIGLEHRINGKQVIITEKKVKPVTKDDNKNGLKTVKGTVVDNSNEPLIGATISTKLTLKKTITDLYGNFSIDVPENDVLVFSNIGFVKQEVAVRDESMFNITMAEDEKVMDEIVVVGYGVQKKSDITGSVSSINTEKLEKMPFVNITDALQGSVAGLNISRNSNSAEGSFDINIRGSRSFAGGNDPLIILDGIPFMYSLSEISTESIASIEILKDASASAIYGARAANGVILITSKKGTKDTKTKIQYSQSYGVENIAHLPDMMDTETYYKRKLERFGTIEKAFTASELRIYDSGKPTDWLKEVSRQGTRANYNLSLSGGSKVSNYFISASYNDVKGITKGDDFKRFNLQTNIELEVNSWIKVGTNTLLTYLDRSGLPADWSSAFRMNPLTEAYNEDKTQKFYPWPEDNGFTNPLNDTFKDNKEIGRSVIMNNYLILNIPGIKDLTYKINTGYTYRGALSQTYSDRLNTFEGFKNNGYASTNDVKRENWIIENIVDYKKSFNKNNFFLTAMYSAQQYTQSSYATNAYGFPTDVMTYYQPNNAATTEMTASYTRNNHVSQMGRLNYNYDGKYLFTSTARRDGYSAFGNNKKYGVFTSVALGWNIYRESFMESAKYLSNLKLRLSYGENGNEGISAYSTLAQLTSLDYSDGSGDNLVGYYPSRLSNPNLGWETTKTLNGGIDFGFFQNRLQGSIDLYFSNTFDLLLNKSIPSVNGTSSILQNIGETKGNGLEFQITSVNIAKKDFKWTTNLSFECSNNEIVNVGLYDENGLPIDDIGSRRFIGKPISVNYNYVYDGIWQLDEVDQVNLSDWAASAAGDIKYKDIDGDEKITPEDRTIIGRTTPDFTLGLYNTFNYKNVSLSFFFYTSQGITKSNTLFTTDDWDFRRRMYNFNYWSESNPTNDYPINSSRERNALRIPFYENASYIKLKDVSLAYTFPKKVLSKIGIENLELNINAKNPLTITKWKGLDPEFADYIAPTRVYSIGLKLVL